MAIPARERSNAVEEAWRALPWDGGRWLRPADPDFDNLRDRLWSEPAAV